MLRLPISVCIIAKNEEKFIEGCLKKLLQYGFEIVVVDTGSTDRTVEIARQYADIVDFFSWERDFSSARNFCASKATNDWILALDCDEYIQDVNLSELQTCIKYNCEKVGIMEIKNILPREGNKKGYLIDNVARLYNKEFYQFSQRIHEQLTPICKFNTGEFFIPIQVVHYGYDLNENDMRKKIERNIDLLKEELVNTKNKAYIYYQIGQCYFNIEEFEQAIEYYELSCGEGIDLKIYFMQLNVIALSRAYCIVGKKKQAMELLDTLAPLCNTAKFVFNHACIYYENEEYMKAQLLYLKASMMSDVDSLGEEKLYCYQRIIELYHKMGDYDMAKLFEDKRRQCEKELEMVTESAI